MPVRMIDIIVPVYNGAAYIGHFTEMFAAQTDESVRLLFVDDGSADESLKLLHEAESLRRNIRVIHQENRGAAAARNAGLDASDAEYVAFFDIDDKCADDYVSTLKECAVQGGFDLLMFDRQMVWDEVKAVIKNSGGQTSDISRVEALKKTLFDPGHIGGIHSILVSKKYLDRNGIRFAEGYPYYEDFEFTYRALAYADKIRYLDKTLYIYAAKHGNSAMSKFDPERLRCLELYDKSDSMLSEKVPDFAPLFKKYGKARIYWSVLWQAALAAPAYGSFKSFAARTHADIFMRMLKGYPEKKVRLLRALFLFSGRLYYLTVNKLGKKYTAVETADEDTLIKAAKACPDPARVLIYGMSDRHAGLEAYIMELFRNVKGEKPDFLCDFKKMADSAEVNAAGAVIHYIPDKGRHPIGHFAGVVKLLGSNPQYRCIYMNVIHASCAYTALAARLMGRRVVIHSHNSKGEYPLIHKLCRPLLNSLARARAACCKEAAEYMFGKKAGKSMIIPNLIDAEKYAFDENVRYEMRKELGIEERCVIFSAGRLEAQKNPLFLIEILKKLTELGKDVLLLHAGDGILKDEFDEAVKKNKLEKSVMRLGVRDDVCKLMQAADVFLLPSLYEGLPVALLEAQAAGLPCVISSAISPEALITDRVIKVSPEAAADTWAGKVLEAAGTERCDKSADIIKAGFDAGSADEIYKRLHELLLPREV